MSQTESMPIPAVIRPGDRFWIVGLKQSMRRTNEPTRDGAVKTTPKTRDDGRSLYDVASARHAYGEVTRRMPKLQVWLNDEEAEVLKHAIAQLKDPMEELAVTADLWLLIVDENNIIFRMTLTGVRPR